ncbi:hypothetical protein ASF83_08105 [Plantibacter sp. Leaf171]|uniref:DUF58 domain-containing protein n=1 Tax=unclassified Plantibacter TaxID=2624265 RepID=UPI0006F72DA7|nr:MULTISPECIES: DUF58 domain-containing protein [unclassified Plantibacter]KQM15873.1 hypothetical protein ASE44_08120 [Plantibacter sp. Leaf1]KQR59016.1 hypothetical protein ASF83_08105 [Plantibacter sp. Leaf171]
MSETLEQRATPAPDGPDAVRAAAVGAPVEGSPDGAGQSGDAAPAAGPNPIRRIVDGVGAVVGPWAKVAWDAAKPVLDVVSGLGWVVLGIGVVATVAGFILGWAELVFLGFVPLAAILASVAYLFGRSTFRISIHLNPSRVTVGERAIGQVLIANPGGRATTPTRLEVPVGYGLAEFAIPAIPKDGEHEELFAVPTNRRAVIPAGPAVSVRGDQLGLLRREVRWTEPVELFVHPETTRLHPTAAGLIRDLEGLVTKTITNNDISFHALRGYVAGDDRRYIHWKSSAKTGQLMVRQFEETRRSQLTIVMTTDSRYYADDEDEFELAVSLTASIATQVILDQVPISVVTDRLALRTHTVTSFLDDSCRLQLAEGTFETPRTFARETTKRLPAPSVVIIVAGSRLEAQEYRGIQRLFGPDVNVFGIRVERGARASIKDVAGMNVMTVGALGDLAKVMSRAL